MSGMYLEAEIEKQLQNELDAETILDEENIDESDVDQAVEEFIRSPSMNGVDSDARLVMLFEAVHRGYDENTVVCSSCCRHCGDRIDPEEFAEEFVEAYNELQAETKLELTKSTGKAAFSVLRRRWGAAVVTIINNVIPTVQEFIRTESSRINQVEEFPYMVNEDDIYHNSCYEEAVAAGDIEP